MPPPPSSTPNIALNLPLLYPTPEWSHRLNLENTCKCSCFHPLPISTPVQHPPLTQPTAATPAWSDASLCTPPHQSCPTHSHQMDLSPQTLLIPHRIKSSTPPSALQVLHDQGPTCSQYYWSSFCPSNRPTSFFPRGFAHATLSAENTCHPFYDQLLVQVLAQMPHHQRSPLWPLRLKKTTFLVPFDFTLFIST